MAGIRVLDPHVSELIAAGEVVERPGSVVKELLENAFDAGATVVTVEIQGGGLTYIRVTDNGCGIAPEDAKTAFLRHATSKIVSERDLEAIGTLGFRGEALAAIAAVSRVDLLTRVRGAEAGVSLSLEGGVPGELLPAGCPEGTTIIVRDLFFNTPARMKFMKRDTAEGAYIGSLVQQLALSHPEVSVKLIRNGEEQMHTPGDGRLLSSIYSALGREIALGLIPVEGSGEDLRVEGFVSKPVCCKGTRASQYFFVNGRLVKSRIMAAAVEEAYQNRKMVGKFPACVLHVGVKMNTVDVNVHPAKTEIKFMSERALFSVIYHSVSEALAREDAAPQLYPAGPEKAQKPALPPVGQERSSPAFRTMTAEEYRRETAPRRIPVFGADSERKGQAGFLRDSAGGEVRRERLPQAEKAGASPIRDPGEGRGSPAKPSPPVSEQAPSETKELSFHVAGEVFGAYIIAERGDRIFLIDKHAAHERMHFDRLKKEGYVPMGQLLLVPLVVTPGGEEGEALRRNLPLLEEYGFQVEEFGGDSLLVRQVPYDIDPEEAQAFLSELGERFSSGAQTDPGGVRDSLLKTLACKAAIKSGQKNGLAELQAVAAAVISGKVKYCPHGRPVAVELTRAALERQFKRT